jgi:hypothetical protein
VCGEAVERVVDLGLLEVMPRGDLRVSRVLGLVCPEDEPLIVAAARELYGVWKNEESEERRLEMHRLAMVGKVENIAAEIGRKLTVNWITKRSGHYSRLYQMQFSERYPKHSIIQSSPV